MTQDILIHIIAGFAACYTIYSLVRTIISSNNSGCGSGCSSCSAKKDLFEQIKNSKHNLTTPFQINRSLKWSNNIQNTK